MTSNINWFGKVKEDKKKTKTKAPTFFTTTKHSANNTKITKATFMKPVKLRRPVYPNYNSLNKRSALVSSEVLLYGKKNLQKYGDRDMDGSPNMFDCSPNNVRKDGFFSNLLHKVTSGKFGQSDKDYAIEKREKKQAKEYPASQKQKEILSAKYNRKPEEYTETKVLEDGTTQTQTKIRHVLDTESKTGKTLKKQRDYLKMIELEKVFKKAKRKSDEEILSNRRTLLKKKYVPQWVSGEDYDAEPSGVLPALSRTGQMALQSLPKLTVSKTGEWSDETKKAGYNIRKPFAGALVTMLPPGTLTKDVETVAKQAQRYPMPKSKKWSDGSRYESRGKPGRPVGSYKPSQYIPGAGLVDVYTWRKYQRKQRAIARMSGPQAQQQYATQQYAVAQQMQSPSPDQYAPTQVYDQGNYDEQAYQAPRTYDPNNLPPDQAVEVQNTSQRYQRAMWNQRHQEMMAKMNPLQQAQLNEQKNDNPLNAPNFMKGELTNVGGQNSMTYTPPESNILNAPNVNMGQMRNVNSMSEKPAVTLSERPITNPYGEQFTDINPITGQTVLRRRIAEKYMTGQAY